MDQTPKYDAAGANTRDIATTLHGGEPRLVPGTPSAAEDPALAGEWRKFWGWLRRNRDRRAEGSLCLTPPYGTLLYAGGGNTWRVLLTHADSHVGPVSYPGAPWPQRRPDVHAWLVTHADGTEDIITDPDGRPLVSLSRDHVKTLRPHACTALDEPGARVYLVTFTRGPTREEIVDRSRDDRNQGGGKAG